MSQSDLRSSVIRILKTATGPVGRALMRRGWCLLESHLMTTLAAVAPTTKVSQSKILALIVPVYNEAENFPALLAEIEQHIPPPFVLNVVYDFDEDTTVPVVRRLAEGRPWLRLLKNRLGRGVSRRSGPASRRSARAQRW